MVIENKDIEKICNFYVSDFHLEMILLPYINKKIEEQEPIQIVSEKNLEDSINELISKVNIKENIKRQVLEMNWNSDKLDNIKTNSNIIIIGTEKFIKEKNREVGEKNKEKIKIINCFNFEEVKNDMDKIILQHDNNLNTLGSDMFKKGI